MQYIFLKFRPMSKTAYFFLSLQVTCFYLCFYLHIYFLVLLYFFICLLFFTWARVLGISELCNTVQNQSFSLFLFFNFELSALLIRTMIKDVLWKSPFLNFIVSSRRRIGLSKVFLIRYYCFFVYPFNVTTYYFCLFSN